MGIIIFYNGNNFIILWFYKCLNLFNKIYQCFFSAGFGVLDPPPVVYNPTAVLKLS